MNHHSNSDGALAGLPSPKACPIGWWRVRDPETTWWSEEMYSIFGWSREDGIPDPKQIFSLYHPDDSHIVGRSWRHWFNSDVPHEIRYRLLNPDGRCRTVITWGCRQQPNELGERWVVGYVIDVSQHLDDQDAFQRERAYRFVADHTQDMVVRSSLDGGITYVSPACKTVLGYSATEMIGRSPADFVEPDDLFRLKSVLKDRIRRRELVSPSPSEYRARHKDGRLVWLEGNPRLVLNGGGQLTEMVDVIRNITERKDAEIALVAARSAAEAAAASKSEFLANMSHELRTPLTSILGFSRLVAAEPGLTDVNRQHLQLISSAGETLLAVVNDILDFSKLEASAITLQDECFCPKALIEGVVELLSEQARQKGLGLEATFEGAATLRGDDTRLRQVLMNLVGNAVKFTTDGQVRVSGRLEEADGGLRRLCVDVEDTGIGIHDGQAERLFDRFTQADGSVSRRFGGTGLGLAISRKLIELMGGQIGAKRNPHRGSTFWFRVDLPEAGSEGVNASQETQSAAAPDRVLRILLAEDNLANQTLIRAMLEPFSLRLDCVDNGAEALAAVREGDYDLVLMDMQMPIMDGLAATRAIRALDGPARSTPIIALTANVLPEQVAQCVAAGMQGHLAKPIDLQLLMATLVRFGSETLPADDNPVSEIAG